MVVIKKYSKYLHNIYKGHLNMTKLAHKANFSKINK